MKSAQKVCALLTVIMAGLACAGILLRPLFVDPVEERVRKALREPSSGPYGNYSLSDEAHQEIKTLGTNALPYLIRAMDHSAGDSKLDKWILRQKLDSRLRRFGYLPRWEICEHILHSFHVLGEIAVDAVPALSTRLHRDQTAWLAALCLVEIGGDGAVSALEEAAQSSSKAIRAAAKEGLRVMQQTCELTPPSP